MTLELTIGTRARLRTALRGGEGEGEGECVGMRVRLMDYGETRSPEEGGGEEGEGEGLVVPRGVRVKD